MTTTLPGQDTTALLARLDLGPDQLSNGDLDVRTPITGELLARVPTASPEDVERSIASAVDAFRAWRDVPAPRRGELVRLLGEELRQEKEALGGRWSTIRASRSCRPPARPPWDARWRRRWRRDWAARCSSWAETTR
jgi:hypothetical protein